MEKYPHWLIPKPFFKQNLGAEITTRNRDRYFQRIYKGNLFDSGTETINEKAIADNPEHLWDFSINLLGLFNIENGYLTIHREVDSRRSSTFYSDWKKPEEGIKPKPNEFFKDSQKKSFFISYKKFHNQPTSQSAPHPRKFEAFCKLVHKPTKINYWHYEMKWYDTNDNVIVPESRSQKKKLGSFLRAFLSEKIETESPEFFPDSPNIYIQFSRRLSIRKLFVYAIHWVKYLIMRQ
jgi:hypothetical protein